MDILNKPISSLSFNDVVAFCGQQEPEGIQIEYKRDMTTSSVSKSIAAFSNTRGGVIIIGVDENRNTGLPGAWNGIPNSGNHRDRIHQWAANITPIPHYDVHITDEQGGNVFVLIRVFEGDNTPYYVQNDSHLWIRTGNVSTPIDMAPPGTQAMLYNKKTEAELSRSNYIQLSERIWSSSVKKAEIERLSALRNAQVSGDGNEQGLYTTALGVGRARLRVHIQPYYPHTPIAKPSEIQARLNDIRITSNAYYEFPPINMSSMPEGLLNFIWDNEDGKLFCQQIYATGLIQSIEDISDTTTNGEPRIHSQNIAAKIFILLKAATNLYRIFPYQGNLVGYALLEEIQDYTHIVPIYLSGGLNSHAVLNQRISLLPNYRWELNLDTTILNDPEKLQAYFIEVVKDIYWQLGLGEADENIIKGFLRENHWLVE